MGGANGDHFSKKKGYHEPTCESKSVLEVVALLREDLPGWQEAHGLPFSPEEFARPILVVEDYEGHVHSMREAIQDKGVTCDLSTAANESQLALICEAAGALQPNILVLDLRKFEWPAEDAGRDVLKEVSTWPQLRLVPLIILVDSAARSQTYRDPHGYWWLRRPVDTEQCATALRSLLDLRAAILNQSKKKQEDGGARTCDSGAKVGDRRRTGTGEEIDWEGICKEINE